MTPEVLSPNSCPTDRPRDTLQMRRRLKSPEILETTFTMSTIEEEIENVSTIALMDVLQVVPLLVGRMTVL